MRKQLLQVGSDKRKKAFVIGTDSKISELVSLILEDLGFESRQIISQDKLQEVIVLEKPELIIWDLPPEKICNLSESLSKVIELLLEQKIKVLFLGDTDFKSDLNAYSFEGEVRLCLKPFSPTMFRYEFGQLYGVTRYD